MFSDEQQEILNIFSDLSDKLFSLGIIRTDSFTGEIGEYIVSKHYNLKRINRVTRAVDAIDKSDQKYQIKAKIVTNHNFNFSNANIRKCEIDYLVVVFFDTIYRPLKIVRIPAHQLPENKVNISDTFLRKIDYEIILAKDIKIPESDFYEIINFGKQYNLLLENNIIRSRRIVGDIGEFYASKYLQLYLYDNPNKCGVDAIDDLGLKYEIKTRRVYESDRRKGNTRRLNNLLGKSAEILVVVTLDRQFKCSGMWTIPMQNIHNPKSATLTIVNSTQGVKNIVKSKIEWLT